MAGFDMVMDGIEIRPARPLDADQIWSLVQNFAVKGFSLLGRDVDNVTDWFGRRGVECDPSDLFDSLLREAFQS